MDSPKQDIRSRADIELLINRFYEKVMADEVISFIFTEVAKIDLEQHLPILYDFWASVLLQEGAYRRNVMQGHIELDKKQALTKAHFERWQQLFEATLDEHFVGPVATDARRRVELMKNLMQFKIAQSRENGFVA